VAASDYQAALGGLMSFDSWSRTALGLAFLVVAVQPASSGAWGYHYLVADRSLGHAEDAVANTMLQVEPLEDFLAAEPDALKSMFAGYYDWLDARGDKRHRRIAYDPSRAGVDALLQAARLNPAASFPLVNRVLPLAALVTDPVPAGLVSRYLVEVPPLVMSFEDATGRTVSARSVLSTFADEPDWGFDHELWDFLDYGYGTQPYGKAKGESSKAAFHMEFLHENGLVRKFVPELDDGMVEERMELFLRLARLAHQTGHPYWGWRFTAWTTHYAQDLCQPYHAAALPSKGMGYYLRYIVSPRKEHLKDTATQLAVNRHFAYEDFVAYGLQRNYTEPMGSDLTAEALGAYLAGVRVPPGMEAAAARDLPEIQSAGALLEWIAAAAADHAPAMDKAIVRAFPRQYTRDASYDFEHDPDYTVEGLWDSVDDKHRQKLLDETGADFYRAGQATRAVVRLALQAE
jgi:hypothetical protein